MQIHETSNSQVKDSHVTFNPIYANTLHFTASVLNSGNFEIQSSYFYYHIDAMGSHCTWPVIQVEQISELEIYDLSPYASGNVDKTVSFPLDNCACADTFSLSYVTLRFSFFQSHAWTAASYASTSYDITVGVDCTFFPFLPALAFYVRPYVLEVNQWCAEPHILSCGATVPNAPLDIIFGTDWSTSAQTTLSLKQVDNPPAQYENVELANFPLPQHNFYLHPSEEGKNKSDIVLLSSSPASSESLAWMEEQGSYK